MDDFAILGRGDDHPLRKHFLACFGPPAYVRRARAVQDALDQLLERCQRQRAEWLALVRARLGMLRALAGEWAVLRPLLHDDEQLDILRHLHSTLQPRLRLPVRPTRSSWKHGRALWDLLESITRFNRRCQDFVTSADLGQVNGLRADYNRYYVVEKECAVRSSALARQGFSRLEPLTPCDLLSMLPPLPMPRLAG
jgi:hypothetical protein